MLTGTGSIELSKSMTGSVISDAILSAIWSMSSPRSPLLSAFAVDAVVVVVDVVVSVASGPVEWGVGVGDLQLVFSEVQHLW